MTDTKARLVNVWLALALLGSVVGAHAGPIYSAGSLEFSSSGQSMWGSGGAFRQSESVFVGAQWSNKTATIGGIAGSANAVVIPAIDPIYTNVWVPRVWVPTPTWRNPLKGYYTGCGCTKRVKVFGGTDAVTADTRTGAQIDLTTSGKVGLDFGYSIDSGSVDTTANFGALAELPDQIVGSEFFSLNTSSSFDSGTVITQSPKIDAYMSTIMQLSGDIQAQACALTFGCKSSGKVNLPSVDLDQRILSADLNSVKILEGLYPNGDPLAELPILNQSLTLEGGATVAPPAVGFKLTGPFGTSLVNTLPPTPSLTVDLAELEVQVPDIATNGVGSGTSVEASGRDDLIKATVDIDGAASLFAGMPPTGVNFDLVDAGVFKIGASLDLIDVDAGPVIGVRQDFEFTPTLMATLNFSNPVEIFGLAGTHTSWTGAWSSLPQLAISALTQVTPTFWIEGLFNNNTGLDLGLVGTMDLLKLGATASVGGVDLLGFTPLTLNRLLGLDNELFSTDKLSLSVFDNSFLLGGFNMIEGPSFTLDVTKVPEPSSIVLLLGGLSLLALRKSVARNHLRGRK